MNSICFTKAALFYLTGHSANSAQHFLIGGDKKIEGKVIWPFFYDINPRKAILISPSLSFTSAHLNLDRKVLRAGP